MKWIKFIFIIVLIFVIIPVDVFLIFEIDCIVGGIILLGHIPYLLMYIKKSVDKADCGIPD